MTSELALSEKRPEDAPDDGSTIYVDDSTGLVIVRYPLQGTWRIYKQSRDPLSGRPRTDPNPNTWNRFDIANESTLYSSTLAEGAYAEVLAPLRPRIDQLTALAREVFGDVGDTDNPIVDEWNQMGHMIVGNIPRVWHAERGLAQLWVPVRAGWYIDIEHPISLQVLRTQFARLLEEQGFSDMDVAVVRGDNRIITCAIAEWVNTQYLADGSQPLGIRYRSRHGTEWECWATFPDTAATVLAAQGIDCKTDQAFAAIAKMFGLRIHH